MCFIIQYENSVPVRRTVMGVKGSVTTRYNFFTFFLFGKYMLEPLYEKMQIYGHK